MAHIARHLGDRLLADAGQMPVVTLTGPRQSGKTTLVRRTFPDHNYATLEDPEDRAEALADPRGFLNRFKGPLILDEAQHAPDLFSYIQVLVDEQDRPGRFVLTGSQNFLLMRSVSQSLAGRAAIHHLLPLSLDELLGRPARAMADLGRPLDAGPNTKDLFDVLHTGFYPRIHDKGLAAQDWLRSYHQSYLQRDVRSVLNVGDLEAFTRFVSLCAGRAGGLLNLSAMAGDCGVAQPTARRWLSVLEASFIVTLLRPWHRNFSKRLVKAPKLHFIDTGLLCYLLRIRTSEDLRLHSSRGAVFESFVVSELTKRALNAGRDPDLYFWRDSRGREIDVLVDLGPQQILVEAKSGQTVGADFFNDIKYWRTISGLDETRGVMVYGGERHERRQEGEVAAWWRL